MGHERGGLASMYTIDSRDLVRERKDLPQSSVGAPHPMLFAYEGGLHLAYYLQKPDVWKTSSDQTDGDESNLESCALVRFVRPLAHLFGPPSDETFEGHPLAARGLRPYSVFEIENSSWIRGLVQMDSVHPRHRPERFQKYKHFVFTFHDEVFECVAESFELSMQRGAVAEVLQSSWAAG
jgi:hypothetical protein